MQDHYLRREAHTNFTFRFKYTPPPFWKILVMRLVGGGYAESDGLHATEELDFYNSSFYLSHYLYLVALCLTLRIEKYHKYGIYAPHQWAV